MILAIKNWFWQPSKICPCPRCRESRREELPPFGDGIPEPPKPFNMRCADYERRAPLPPIRRVTIDFSMYGSSVTDWTTDADDRNKVLMQKLCDHPNVQLDQMSGSVEHGGNDIVKFHATGIFRTITEAEKFKDGLLDGSLFGNNHGVTSIDLQVEYERSFHERPSGQIVTV